MTVDLSKAVKGATVKFRCGGEAVIDKIEPYMEGMKILTFLYNDNGVSVNYCPKYWNDGRANDRCDDPPFTPFDIISITPPAFDWAAVKWGDAFTFAGETVWFIGRTGLQLALVSYVKPEHCYSKNHISILDQFNLTRAPEHDIQVQS